ncbi:hypothetical protein K474DRAFT_1711971 [Panus rudis PR-1116 ss-1]|nr:hypothetical protein K474DRAFT_1711971 [Panus rudis PR-1116 ss-1]
MLLSWTSAGNCARLYDIAFQSPNPILSDPDGLPFVVQLKNEHVWDAFTVLCLLEDCNKRGTILRVPHGGDQSARFIKAMEERNKRIRTDGMPEVAHFCDKCTHFYKDADGKDAKTSCIVIDGITIGHPCCAVHNCKIPLARSRDRFCPTHEDQKYICSILRCNEPVVPSRLTCNNPTHQAAEQRLRARGEARFQLLQRLQRARLAMANESLPQGERTAEDMVDDGEEQAFDVNPAGEIVGEDAGPEACPDKPLSGNRRITAQFGRKRTHNELIFVAPCGVIVARDTCYGAEAVSSVIELFKRIYFVGFKPDHLFFDNNCRLAAMVRGGKEPFFDDVGLTVDVFHFKSKHSINDHFCQQYCNPIAYPELRDEKGNWRFNSSIAEQTNVWLAGYNAICREMTVEKFNFFLDEMIMRHNRITLARLQLTGQSPDYWKLSDMRH